MFTTQYIINNPLSMSQVEDISNMIDILTYGLLSSVQEDKTFTMQQVIPMVLQSLLGLKLALDDFDKTLLRLVSSRKVSLSTYKSKKDKNSLSISYPMQCLMLSVDDSLNRLVRGFHDVIPLYPCPSIYSALLERKLRLFSSN